jgi:uncharacterized protein (TIGR03067 family)
MKQLAISLLICVATGCATSNSNVLNGSWIPVKQEMGGAALPEAAIAKQELVISDSTYAVTAESVDKGIVKYANGKMDIYGREGVNSGKHFTAMYKLENDELTICYNLMGDGYPASFDTKGNPMYFLSVFKRK